MEVSSNQKIGGLARIAYLALLRVEVELGEEDKLVHWLLTITEVTQRILMNG
jgi:hypothetical protein